MSRRCGPDTPQPATVRAGVSYGALFSQNRSTFLARGGGDGTYLAKHSLNFVQQEVVHEA
jgi:hypothetical protein